MRCSCANQAWNGSARDIETARPARPGLGRGPRAHRPAHPPDRHHRYTAQVGGCPPSRRGRMQTSAAESIGHRHNDWGSDLALPVAAGAASAVSRPRPLRARRTDAAGAAHPPGSGSSRPARSPRPGGHSPRARWARGRATPSLASAVRGRPRGVVPTLSTATGPATRSVPVAAMAAAPRRGVRAGGAPTRGCVCRAGA